MFKAPKNVSAFHYQDYRQFLRDWYVSAKSRRGAFSLRAFSQRAGFTSPNYFKLVMDGDRNLSEDSIPKFMKGLGLNKQEQEFFHNLVLFNQATTHEKKDHYYRRLLQSRKFRQLKPFEKSQYEFWSAWYYPIVRELLCFKDCDGTPEWIAAHIKPQVTVEQVEKAMTVLKNLGLIEKTGSNKWKQTSSLMSTGPEVSSVILMNYHYGLLQLARETLDQLPPPERDVSAMTIGIARDRLPWLKKMIQDFRQEVLKFASIEDNPDTAVQLDIQMFPLSIKDASKQEGGTPS
ncbi:MAG TPA: TIGR02147 family protein [bacterium]|nr:TIGR02147 family protein [bacterium]